MQEYKLESTKRTEKGEKIRNESTIPAVVYGAGKENENISLIYKSFSNLYELAGSSSLIDLAIDGKDDGKVLVQDLQYDPISNRIMHIDFKRIEMNKEMEADVSLTFIGEAPAVKEHGGTLMKGLEEVTVRCLPKDLLSEIKIDLSVLKTFDDVIRVKDIIVNELVVIINPGENEVVAKAIPALSEEELQALEEAESDVANVEVVGEKKEEGEEGDKKDDKGEDKGEDKKEDSPR